MKRTNWHSEHPPACTCADCSQRKFEQRRLSETTGGRKIGRNEPCPCGSGKKYKKCHAS